MNFEYFEKYTPAAWSRDLRDQLKRHIYARSEEAFARGDAGRDAIATKGQLERRQHAVRRFFERCLGGLPARNTPLNPQITGTLRGKGFIIDKVIFESQPGHFVTANVYLPANIKQPTGAVLYICGHARDGRLHPGYQEIFQRMAASGLVVLAQDTLGQGERCAYYDARRKKALFAGSTAEHEYMGNQCLPLGDGVARYFLHDALRGIDYLRSRPEVDGNRIGVTGESGGGLHTAMLMMAEPDIAAAAPALFITNRQTYMEMGGAQDAEQIWRGFTAAGFDHEDMLLAMAPRPVRVLAAAYDFFPIEGTRRTVERCRRFWALAGGRCRLDLVEDKCPHSYTPKILRAMLEFFCSNLLGKKSANAAFAPAPFPPHRLWCTKSGQVSGELKGAHFVYDANCRRLSEIKKTPGVQRGKALGWLRRRVFSGRKACALNTRCLVRETMGKLSVDSLLWWSHEGIFNHALAFRLKKWEGRELPVTLAIWDGDTTALRPHEAWIRQQCGRGRAVVVLNVSGAGAILPNRILEGRQPQECFGALHKLADDLSWLGDDLAALRTFDVTRAVDMIAQWHEFSSTGIQIYAHGRQGIYGQLAAALDRRIRKVQIRGGIGSFARLIREPHYDATEIKSVILHGMLHHFDLPDLKIGK